MPFLFAPLSFIAPAFCNVHSLRLGSAFLLPLLIFEMYNAKNKSNENKAYKEIKIESSKMDMDLYGDYNETRHRFYGGGSFYGFPTITT